MQGWRCQGRGLWFTRFKSENTWTSYHLQMQFQRQHILLKTLSGLGLDPSTFRTEDWCSTNWANQAAASVVQFSHLLLHSLQLFLTVFLTIKIGGHITLRIILVTWLVVTFGPVILVILVLCKSLRLSWMFADCAYIFVASGTVPRFNEPLYNEVLVWRTIFFSPAIVRCTERTSIQRNVVIANIF